MAVLGLAFFAGVCTQTLDAGHNRPSGLLFVDECNSVIFYQDDWFGDWFGEYAVLFANSGGSLLVGIVINRSAIWGNLSLNTLGWNDLVNAVRASGFQDIFFVTFSDGGLLVRLADGAILSTTKNDSAGARKIIELSLQWSTPSRLVVVVSTTSLTDLADAYLIDQSVVDCVVVVAAFGSVALPNGIMGLPNGNMDSWAGWIVAQRFRYVHVGTWYDQTGDVRTDQLSDLLQNPFGSRIADKVSLIIPMNTVFDQVVFFAVALPTFVTAAQRASLDISVGFDPTQGLRLVLDAGGNVWVVTQVAGSFAAGCLWEMLLFFDIFGL